MLGAGCRLPPKVLNQHKSGMKNPCITFRAQDPSDLSCQTAALHLQLMTKADTLQGPKSLIMYVFSLHNASQSKIITFSFHDDELKL